MSEEARYVRVGAFVFAGIALAVAGTLVIGGSRFFREPLVVETVFTESVQGVEVGSPVKLRGVKLGSVSWIGFVSDAYSLDDSPAPMREGDRVLVRMDIDVRGIESDPLVREENLREQIDMGLRLRLTPLGITGTSFIQADYVDPARYPPIQISYEPAHLYIPSAPSTISQISSAAERLMTRIDRLDVEGLLTNFDTLLVNVNQSVGKADVEGARKSVGELLADLRATSAEARKAIASASLGDTSADARRALDQTTQTLARLQAVLDLSGDDLAATFENLRVATENLREVSETARAYPSLLLLGEPPKPSGESGAE